MMVDVIDTGEVGDRSHVAHDATTAMVMTPNAISTVSKVFWSLEA